MSDRTSPRVILGSARSGTTWLQDVLARSNGLRTVFEPLHPMGDRRASEFAHRYLSATDELPALEEFFDDVLAGRGLRLWSDLRVNPAHVFRWQSPIGYLAQMVYTARGLRRHARERGRPVLAKLIRGNLMGAWLATRLDAKVLFVLRHPCSVVSSQLKLEASAWHDWRELLRFHLRDERLIHDHLGPMVDFLSSLTDPVDLRAALWCIENAIPVRETRDSGIEIVCYEDLVLGDDRVWIRVLDSLGLSVRPSGVMQDEPSQQASVDVKREGSSRGSVRRWRDHLDAGETMRVQSMLDRFEVEFYSTTEVLPLRSSF